MMKDPGKSRGKLNSNSSKNYLEKMSYISLFILIAFASVTPQSNGQPFLNSLAVLFRARPPWPTTFPSAKFTPIPAPFVQGVSPSQQGLLVAHPINPTSVTNFDNSNNSSSSSHNNNNNNNKSPDTIATIATIATIPLPHMNKNPHLQQNHLNHIASASNNNNNYNKLPSNNNNNNNNNNHQQQQNFMSVSSLPTLSSPAYPLPQKSPIPGFQNVQSIVNQHFQQQNQNQHQQQQQQQQQQQYSGIGNVPQNQNQNQHQHQHQHQNNGKGTIAINSNNLPILVSSPTSLIGSFALPEVPTTVANPNYGVLLENGNTNNGNNIHAHKNIPPHHLPQHNHHHHPHHSGKKNRIKFRDSAWNPVSSNFNTINENHNQNSNNNNNNIIHDNDINISQNQNQIQHPMYPSAAPLHNAGTSMNAIQDIGIGNGNINTDHHDVENSRRQKKLKDFRPSPQLSQFVETTVVSDYTTHMSTNNNNNNNDNNNHNHNDGSGTKGHEDQSNGGGNNNNYGSDVKDYPRFESGFRPISVNQYAASFGTTSTRPHYTNSQQQYFNPWSLAFDQNNPNNPNPNSQQNSQQHQEPNDNNIHEDDGKRDEKPFRQDRQIIGGGGGGSANHGGSSSEHIADVSQSVEDSVPSSEEGTGEGEQEDVDPLVFFGNRGKKPTTTSKEYLEKVKAHRNRLLAAKGKKSHRANRRGGGGTPLTSTTASSELVEEWLPPNLRIQKKSDSRRSKYPLIYANAKKHKTLQHHAGNRPGSSKPEMYFGPKGMMKLPDKCEKFQRFGFCPVTRQYPLDAAEKIASRCSALLSHLIAPLPKMDVQYDIGELDKNETGAMKGRTSSGWAWRSYQGKPVCDTDEITTVPGWAKNENGDWMIILQTKIWQQKAHISLCSPEANHCQGLNCNQRGTLNKDHDDDDATGKDNSIGQTETKNTKCVQRFTAQRLAVFDPQNPDFCPVVRSVFLPSACVCLTTAATNAASHETRSSSEEYRDGERVRKHDSGERQRFSRGGGRQPLFSSDSHEEEMHFSDGTRDEEGDEGMVETSSITDISDSATPTHIVYSITSTGSSGETMRVSHPSEALSTARTKTNERDTMRKRSRPSPIYKGRSRSSSSSRKGSSNSSSSSSRENFKRMSNGHSNGNTPSPDNMDDMDDDDTNNNNHQDDNDEERDTNFVEENTSDENNKNRKNKTLIVVSQKYSTKESSKESIDVSPSSTTSISTSFSSSKTVSNRSH